MRGFTADNRRENPLAQNCAKTDIKRAFLYHGLLNKILKKNPYHIAYPNQTVQDEDTPTNKNRAFIHMNHDRSFRVFEGSRSKRLPTQI